MEGTNGPSHPGAEVNTSKYSHGVCTPMAAAVQHEHYLARPTIHCSLYHNSVLFSQEFT